MYFYDFIFLHSNKKVKWQTLQIMQLFFYYLMFFFQEIYDCFDTAHCDRVVCKCIEFLVRLVLQQTIVLSK